MSICTDCKKEFSGDLGYCPYCGKPLLRKSRSYVAKTLGGPGGFKPSEIPEYLSRKSQAIVMIIVGIFVFLAGFLFLYPNIFVGLSIMLVGAIVALYGQHQWSKITHIMWTRQALREYGLPSIIEGKSVDLDTEKEYQQINKKLVDYGPIIPIKCSNCNNQAWFHLMGKDNIAEDKYGYLRCEICSNQIEIYRNQVDDMLALKEVTQSYINRQISLESYQKEISNSLFFERDTEEEKRKYYKSQWMK